MENNLSPRDCDDHHTLTLAWPGKSALGNGPPHPAVYHMLDVAAVAERLLAPTALPEPLKAALTVLVCLHDLGKMTPSFRAMLLEGQTQIHRHWELSEVLLLALDASVLEECIGARRSARAALYAAVSGHHGRPPSMNASQLSQVERHLAPESFDAASAFARVVCGLWPDANLGHMRERDAMALGWWLAGLTNVADWVGSNTDWFPSCPPGDSMEAYRQHARHRATFAVRAAGLEAAAISKEVLFEFPLRPMQMSCRDMPLPDGPVMAVIEDETGAGKTEAAMILAQRMMVADKGRGMFLALPTMATADSMFRRMRDVVGRLFDRPSLALAHGRSTLSDDFRAVIGRDSDRETDVTCAPWLADGRRRALLAQIGVGTVDQALLGVLPTRFATLRLWGLSSKILIVDEVHELGEPYMATALQRLIESHAAQGGSIILLTATLPLAQRAGLLSAFARGVGGSLETDSDQYPALTLAGKTADTWAVAPVVSQRPATKIERLEDPQAAYALLADKVAAGATCVWIRNAVDDAISAVTALRKVGIEADLLHARFALCDRKRLETAMVSAFGKEGTDRVGRVLVATQVVESSLDLDFDVMISDLAPMASLIQRAGRLWRHMDLRPQAQRPVDAPVLYLVSPDPDDIRETRWLREVQPSGAWVYPASDTWRTARILFRVGWIDAPQSLRELIEGVHGEDVESVPPVLDAAEIEAEGARQAEKVIGYQNVVDLKLGYRDGGGGLKDTHYPTRLGRTQQVLALACRDGAGALRPLVGGMGPEAWMLSEVSAAKYRLDALRLPDQEDPAIKAVTRDWPEWRRQEIRLCPLGDDGRICDGLRYDQQSGLIFEP